MKTLKEVDYVIDGIIEVDGEYYVDQKSYDDVWKLYADLLDKAVKLNYWFEKQGLDVDEILENSPSTNEILYEV